MGIVTETFITVGKESGIVTKTFITVGKESGDSHRDLHNCG